MKVSNTARRALKLFVPIQIFNAGMDFAVWIAYGYHVPSWALALVMLFKALIIGGLLYESS